MIPPPPTSFTPAHEALEIVVYAVTSWGVAVSPNCGRVDLRHIICTVDFPPVNGRYLGWSVVFRWTGRKVVPRVAVVPQT